MDVYLAIVVGLMLQLLLGVYGYGKVVQKVEDLIRRVTRIELQLDGWRKEGGSL